MNICDKCSEAIDVIGYWTFDDFYKFCSKKCAEEALHEIEEETGIYGVCHVTSRFN